MEKKNKLYLCLIYFIVFTISIISLGVGYYSLSLADIIAVFSGNLEGNAYSILFNIRLPRVIAALMIGASLSVSGAAYQGMFKNPLVSPDILGVSAGASAGAALAITLGLGLLETQLFAFVAGLLSVCLTYLISLKSRHSHTLTIVLTGTMISGLAQAFVAITKYISSPNNTLPEITFWLMGSLTKASFEGILFSLIPMTIGFIIIYLYRWKLNLLMLSDSEAKSIGINPKRTKFFIILASTLLSASAVCLGGLIGFIGLIIPHIARFFFGANYRYVIPASIGLGAGFLLVIDTLARTIFSVEIPLGIMTALIGAPFFIVLIVTKT